MLSPDQNPRERVGGYARGFRKSSLCGLGSYLVNPSSQESHSSHFLHLAHL